MHRRCSQIISLLEPSSVSIVPAIHTWLFSPFSMTSPFVTTHSLWTGGRRKPLGFPYVYASLCIRDRKERWVFKFDYTRNGYMAHQFYMLHIILYNFEYYKETVRQESILTVTYLVILIGAKVLGMTGHRTLPIPLNRALIESITTSRWSRVGPT